MFSEIQRQNIIGNLFWLPVLEYLKIGYAESFAIQVKCMFRIIPACVSSMKLDRVSLGNLYPAFIDIKK